MAVSDAKNGEAHFSRRADVTATAAAHPEQRAWAKVSQLGFGKKEPERNMPFGSNPASPEEENVAVQFGDRDDCSE